MKHLIIIFLIIWNTLIQSFYAQLVQSEGYMFYGTVPTVTKHQDDVDLHKNSPPQLKRDVSIVELVRGTHGLDHLQTKCVHITPWKCLMDLWSHFYLINELQIIHIIQRRYIVPQLMKEQQLAHKHTLSSRWC